MLAKPSHTVARRALVALIAAALLAPVTARAQISAFAADQNTVFVQTPTQVRFVATIAANPNLIKTGVTLLQESGGVTRTIGAMNDTGTAGDAVAGDNKFTAVVTLNEAALGELHFQASAAYKGTLLRVRSSTFNVIVSPAVELTVQAGEEEFLVTVGESWSTAFTLDLQNKLGAPAQLNAVEVAAPTGAVTFISDKPAGGWQTSATSQTFLVQNTLTASTVGDFQVTLTGTLQVSGQTLQRAAQFTVHVLPSGGVGFVTLSASPAGLQTNTSAPVLFGANYAGGTLIPDSVVLEEVTATGAFVRQLGSLRDDGSAPDLSVGDEIYSGEFTLTGGPAPSVSYFRATAHFANGATALTAIEPLPTLPYSIGFVPPNDASLMNDPLSDTDFYCDQVLVGFNPSASIDAINSAVNSVNGTILGVEPSIGAYQISIPCNGAAGVGAAITTLLQNPLVDTAEPNLISSGSELVPDDPRYGLHYDLNLGQFTNQWAPLKVRADEAWVVSRGGPVIAVLDSGVDYNHEDLSGSVLRPNKCDVPPGVQVKLCPRTVSQPKVIRGPDYIYRDGDPMDEIGHGTHVAGIAAGNGNNGIGVAGIAWESSILAIKIAWPTKKFPQGQINTTAELSAYAYATSRAKILNMSFSGPTASSFCLFNCSGFHATKGPLSSQALNRAVKAGVLPVAAAGNHHTSKFEYPCALPQVLCVGSSSQSDRRSTFSNFGAHVDIAAPGEGIDSTLPVTTQAVFGFGYGHLDGTSMAAPLVSGVAALVWARHPTWTPTQVRNRLIRTAVPLPPPNQQIGPRVDAFEAVFNGGFEDGLSDWLGSGTRSAIPKLGPISPRQGLKFGMISTGPGLVNQSELSQAFAVLPGATNFVLNFDYAMITEEYPEYVGVGFDDDLTITLEGPCMGPDPLVIESVDSSLLAPIAGVDFPAGDNTAGWTGWKAAASVNIPLAGCPEASADFPAVFRLRVRDLGDGEFDTNAVIDNVRMK